MGAIKDVVSKRSNMHLDGLIDGKQEKLLFMGKYKLLILKRNLELKTYHTGVDLNAMNKNK